MLLLLLLNNGIYRLLLLLTSIIYCLELIHSNYYTNWQQDEVWVTA